ncbi:prenyltransferase/squalene oxidase repeat-containing protein [Umezawaea endophytica]|uniref:Squalene cyclase C-terminal domain-containing protein n=1 Tax=Umezawaea endophytica TaxID=1654476 RepID=A0A9X2VVR3_9PSEU|nr:prenyltransferase/squalene oxidase repeat-containing protein [Umezawaea endophytica]MCS7483590.1 hypothetical protein [Umezawaea endophytica]
MSRHDEIAELLDQVGPGRVTDSAYDTGWLARLGTVDAELSDGALEWLRRHQLPDGAWGAPHLDYHHDRLISTLSAATALARNGDPADRQRVERAAAVLPNDLKSLDDDAAGETIGFELLAPALLREARDLGVVGDEVDGALAALVAEREAKLARLPSGFVDNRSVLAHSAEMADADGRRLVDLVNLLSPNGSVGYSPAATAWYASVTADDTAIGYLLSVVGADGGVPNVGPIDVFENAWTLLNIGLTRFDRPEGTDRLLSIVEDTWTPGRGVSFGAGFRPEDGDDTAVASEVLCRAGREPDLEALSSYAGTEYFHCWPTERNPSVSTNVHMLGALRAAGLSDDDPLVRKAVGYLAVSQDGAGSWIDKWHVSPYYATAHAVLAGIGLRDDVFAGARDWLVRTQRADGSWGCYLPTAEETAYCLQALTAARRQGEPVPEEVLRRGYDWLVRHAAEPFPWLWIGKCLYAPDVVVRSAVLSALALVEEERES